MLTLPQNINVIRKFLNLKELAETANVHRRTVYNVLDGKSNHQQVIAVILEKVQEMKTAVAQI